MQVRQQFRTKQEQFLGENRNPCYDSDIVGRAAPRRDAGLDRRGDGAKIAERGAEGIDSIPSRSIRAGPDAAGQESPTAADVQRLPTRRRKAARVCLGRSRPTGGVAGSPGDRRAIRGGQAECESPGRVLPSRSTNFSTGRRICSMFVLTPTRPPARLGRRDRRFGREEGARKKFMSRERGQPLDGVEFGAEKEGKGSFWKAFCDLHAPSGNVPDARLRDL